MSAGLIAPIGQLLLGGWSFVDSLFGREEAKKANEARFQAGNNLLKAHSEKANEFYSGSLDTIKTQYENMSDRTKRNYDDLYNNTQASYNNAMSTSDQRYNDLYNNTLAGYGVHQQDVDARYLDSILDAQKRYAGERSDAKKWFDDLVSTTDSRYQNRLDTAMGMLEGYGDQEKADVTQSWKNRESQGVQDMISSGLTGTTIMPTMKAGYEREKNADLSRVNERLQGQKVGTYSDLSEDQLAAINQLRSMQASNDAGLASQGLSVVDALFGNRVNAYNDIGQARLDAGNQIRSDQNTNYNSLVDKLLGTNTLIQGNRTSDMQNIGYSAINDLMNLRTNRSNQMDNITNSALNWLANREDPYPDMSVPINALTSGFNSLGQALAPPPPQPSSSATWGSGFLNAGSNILGGWLGSN